MPYLFWLSVAVILLIIEILAPAFFFVFFAGSSLLVGGLVYLGYLPEFSHQAIVFAIVAIASLFLLRKKFRETLATPGFSHTLVNEKITLDADIPAGGEARITYQGSSWTGINDTSEAMQTGQKVTIARTEGVRLILQK